MLRIALCDDEHDQRRLVRGMLEDYIGQRRITAKAFSFPSGRELLRAMDGQRFELYLLDIVMPGMDGIQLGRAIRERDREGTVAYLTASPDFALDSFDAKASAYLLKPVEPERLFPVLDDVLSRLKQRREQSLLIRTAEGTARLPLDGILYVELVSRAPCYCLASGARVLGVSLHSSFREAMAPLLADSRFHLCGSSYVFNLHHIRGVSRTGALFAGGQRVAVPRRAAAPLQSAWMDYWLEGGSGDV